MFLASLAHVMIAIRITLAAVSCATMFLEGSLQLCFLLSGAGKMAHSFFSKP